VDGAFRAAIEGGRLAAVRRIWQIAAQTPHPALTFNDVSDDDSHAHKMSPVTLLLSDPPYRTREPGQCTLLGEAAWPPQTRRVAAPARENEN
jgi:hypothetical protein